VRMGLISVIFMVVSPLTLSMQMSMLKSVCCIDKCPPNRRASDLLAGRPSIRPLKVNYQF